MEAILAILLGVGLTGIFTFAVLPFMLETKLVWFLAYVKNPLCRLLGFYGLRRAKRHRILLNMLNHRLNLLIMLSLTFALLTSCASPNVGPKPDVTPVAVSNTATRAEIKNTRVHIKEARARIKEAQIHEAKGDTALEKADDLINQMLKK